MADVKISGLPAATVPLAGTEVLPIVQSGTTKQVSIANVTAGRAISATAITASTGDITSTAGNFVVGTSGKGVDFSATPGTGTSELLADYEEGTWTPIMTASGGGTAGYASQQGRYTKIGRQVTVFFDFQLNTLNTLSGNLSIDGLPFARDVGDILGATNVAAFLNLSTAIISMPIRPVSGATSASLFKIVLVTTSSLASTLTPADCTNNVRLAGTITYNT